MIDTKYKFSLLKKNIQKIQKTLNICLFILSNTHLINDKFFKSLLYFKN